MFAFPERGEAAAVLSLNNIFSIQRRMRFIFVWDFSYQFIIVKFLSLKTVISPCFFSKILTRKNLKDYERYFALIAPVVLCNYSDFQSSSLLV